MSYIPNTDADRAEMLSAISIASLDDLFAPIPKHLQYNQELQIPSRMDQITLAKHFEQAGCEKCSCRSLSVLSGRGHLRSLCAANCRGDYRTVGILYIVHTLSAGS